jgi:hypothetical protein
MNQPWQKLLNECTLAKVVEVNPGNTCCERGSRGARASCGTGCGLRGSGPQQLHACKPKGAESVELHPCHRTIKLQRDELPGLVGGGENVLIKEGKGVLRVEYQGC